MEKLIKNMEAELERCRELYEENRHDSFLSFSADAQLYTTETVLEKLKRGENPAELADKLERDIPRLEELMRHEDEYPTFDEYSPHSHYFIYCGRRDAHKAIIEIIRKSI